MKGSRVEKKKKKENKKKPKQGEAKRVKEVIGKPFAGPGDTGTIQGDGL
ncbi:MAG: hypothetical protein ACM3XR_02215 [Bacillota bacterium]